MFLNTVYVMHVQVHGRRLRSHGENPKRTVQPHKKPPSRLGLEETKKSMQQTAPKETQTEQLTEDMVKRIAKEVVSMMQTETAEPQTEKPLPKGITPLPMEEVEVAGDRINFQFPLLGLAL